VSRSPVNGFITARDIGFLIDERRSWRPEAGTGQIRTTGTCRNYIVTSAIFHQ